MREECSGRITSETPTSAPASAATSTRLPADTTTPIFTAGALATAAPAASDTPAPAVTAMGNRAIATCVLFVCVTALQTGCGPDWRPPIFQRSGFYPQWVSQFTVLPPLDARIDKKVPVDLDGQLNAAAMKILKEKGY
jgi:hypothetical protein